MLLYILLYYFVYRRVGGKEYYGEAKEKAKARQEYTTRSGSGENVGLVESRLMINV